MRSDKASIWGLLFNVFDAILEAKSARLQPETRGSYRKLGYRAIAYSIVACICVSALLLLYILPNAEGWALLAYIVFLPMGLGIGILGTLLMLLNAVVAMIGQFAVNRSAVSWAALLTFLLAVAAIALFLLFFLQHLPF